MTDERPARSICEILRQHGFTALFAGGCVRDRLLGRLPRDYDVATNAEPEQVRAMFPRNVPVGEAFGVVKVLQDDQEIDVVTFRSDGTYRDGRHPDSVAYAEPREDAARRDFTINALFSDPVTGEVLDFTGGLEDLNRRIIRCVGNPRQRFLEDRLRLLRAIRFAAGLGFNIDPDTWDALKNVTAEQGLQGVSAERIRDELDRMLTEGGARSALERLAESGLLAVILPEVAALRGVPQPENFHPEGDVWEHTMRMLALLPPDPPVELAWAVLLHDAGKPRTISFADRIRFHHHEKVGQSMVPLVGRRLRFPNRRTERITWLVGNHMRLAAVPDMREGRRRRFASEPDFPLLVKLARLDSLASHGDLAVIEWIRRYLDSLSASQPVPQPLITGKDLKQLGISPGPVYRDLLQTLHDRQMEGAFTTREEGLKLARQLAAGCQPPDQHSD